jgi:hypothetical protein
MVKSLTHTYQWHKSRHKVKVKVKVIHTADSVWAMVAMLDLMDDRMSTVARLVGLVACSSRPAV